MRDVQLSGFHRCARGDVFTSGLERRSISTPTFYAVRQLVQAQESKFVDRRLAPIQHRNFVRVEIEAEDVDTQIGKASASNQADIAGPDNRDVHIR